MRTIHLLPDEKECFAKWKVIKTASDAKGMVHTMEKEGQVIWYISSMEGIIGHDGPTYDTRDLVIPCNLPDNLKEEGLKVIFSGKLRDSRQDFGNHTHIYYAEINSIRMVEKF